MGIFYSGSLLSGAFGNLMAAGILNGLAGKHGLAPWQWLYIIEGLTTVVIGSLVCMILPDFPETWRLLTPEMKRVATHRLALDAAEADIDTISTITGLKLAMTDIKTYLLALAYMCICAASGFQNFLPTLTATLGYNETISLLLVAPPYLFMLVYSLLHSYLSDRFTNRFWFFIYPIPLSILGFVAFMNGNSFALRYTSLFAMNFVFAMMATCYSWIAGAIPRPPAKRATAYAFINAVGNSASVWTPYMYRDGDAPRYRFAMRGCITLQVVAGVMAVVLRAYLVRQNRELELREVEEEGGEGGSERAMLMPGEGEEENNDDIAGRKMKLPRGFRYVI